MLPWGEQRGDGLCADEGLLDVLLVAGPDTAAGALPRSIRSLHGKITLPVQVTATHPCHGPAHRTSCLPNCSSQVMLEQHKKCSNDVFSTFCQNHGHTVHMLEAEWGKPQQLLSPWQDAHGSRGKSLTLPTAVGPRTVLCNCSH